MMIVRSVVESMGSRTSRITSSGTKAASSVIMKCAVAPRSVFPLRPHGSATIFDPLVKWSVVRVFLTTDSMIKLFPSMEASMLSNIIIDCRWVAATM